MTDRDDADDDDHGDDAPRRDLGEVRVDEPVTPTVDLRTAQEREAAFDTGTTSGGEDCACPHDAASDGLDELAEPTTDLRTAQEKAAADSSVGDVAGETRQEGGDDA